MAYEEFESLINSTEKKSVGMLYVLGTTWATYVQTHSDEWAAVAELSYVKLLINRVLDLDEGYEQGAAHMYMGVIDTLFPPAMGGQPEKGRKHLERAIALSGGKNLYAKVLLADSYARLVYDRQLHDLMVSQVLSADPKAGDLTLQNHLAKQLATELQASANDYF